MKNSVQSASPRTVALLSRPTWSPATIAKVRAASGNAPPSAPPAPCAPSAAVARLGAKQRAQNEAFRALLDEALDD